MRIVQRSTDSKRCLESKIERAIQHLADRQVVAVDVAGIIRLAFVERTEELDLGMPSRPVRHKPVKTEGRRLPPEDE